MSDEGKKDLGIFSAIVIVIVILVAIGFVWGARVTSDIACQNLGYENGHLVALFIGDAKVICTYTPEVPMTNMWISP
jgi:hypothetical protein